MSDRVFAWSPSPDYAVSHEEKVDEVSFGDGYGPRFRVGSTFAAASGRWFFRGLLRGLTRLSPS